MHNRRFIRTESNRSTLFDRILVAIIMAMVIFMMISASVTVLDLYAVHIREVTL